MAWAAVVGGALGIGSALLGSSSAKKAADASASADQQAIAELQRQYDTTRSDQAPYRTVGAGALNVLAAMYGLPQYQAGISDPLSYDRWMATPEGQASIANVDYGGARTHVRKQEVRDRASNLAYNNYLNNFKASGGSTGGGARGGPDFSAFYNSPDYNFARTEGQRGVEQSAAARGGAASGNALRALSEFNQGLASQQFGNYYNRMAGLAGIGQSATNNLGQVGAQYASGIAGLQSGIGQTRASGILGQTAPWTNLLGSFAKGIGGGIFG